MPAGKGRVCSGSPLVAAYGSKEVGTGDFKNRGLKPPAAAYLKAVECFAKPRPSRLYVAVAVASPFVPRRQEARGSIEPCSGGSESPAVTQDSFAAPSATPKVAGFQTPTSGVRRVIWRHALTNIGLRGGLGYCFLRLG
jgi:hypothetical protein